MRGTETSERPRTSPPKISIIGAGMVGATIAYSLTVEQVAGELVLVDLDLDRARGEARDINHALPFLAPTKVSGGDYEACRGSDIIVITAGAAQKSGETRLDLTKKNYEIYQDIIPRVGEVAGEALIVVVSNPVDVLTYAAVQLSDLPPEHVIGSGTVLDTARFRYELSAHCGLDPRNVHAYILGEHGDSEVPIWSLTNVAGVPFERVCESCPGSCEREREHEEIFESVKNAAYEIIDLKGATYYAIGMGTTRIVEAILRDQNTILTASTLLQGQYGIEDVCMSLPVVLGREGVRMVVEMPVSEGERQALRDSAGVLREALGEVGL